MLKSTKEASVSIFERRKMQGVVLVLAMTLVFVSSCVTVRPEQRAVLADPIMQFQGDAREAAQRQHVVENREGSFGGSSVKGGSCSCN